MNHGPLPLFGSVVTAFYNYNDYNDVWTVIYGKHLAQGRRQSGIIKIGFCPLVSPLVPFSCWQMLGMFYRHTVWYCSALLVSLVLDVLWKWKIKVNATRRWRNTDRIIWWKKLEHSSTIKWLELYIGRNSIAEGPSGLTFGRIEDEIWYGFDSTNVQKPVAWKCWSFFAFLIHVPNPENNNEETNTRSANRTITF